MSRQPRFTKPGGELKVVTVRCFQARHLLRPSPELNQRVLGIVARACRRSQIQLIGFAALSNHIHYLVWTPSSEDLTLFMHYNDANISRKVGPLQAWKGTFWETRYQNSAVTDEEAAQVEQLKYLLAQGCKENLVNRPRDWPGLHAAQMILSEKPLKGIWFDQTGYAKALHRGKAEGGRSGKVRGRSVRTAAVRVQDFLHEEVLELSPLPCWAHLPADEYRRRVRELVEEVERETRERHSHEGTRALGRRAVRKQHPHSRPKEPKKSFLPLVKAATREAKARWLESYRIFVSAFRAASERRRQGEIGVSFPAGAYEPSRGYLPIEVRAG